MIILLATSVLGFSNFSLHAMEENPAQQPMEVEYQVTDDEAEALEDLTTQKEALKVITTKVVASLVKTADENENLAFETNETKNSIKKVAIRIMRGFAVIITCYSVIACGIEIWEYKKALDSLVSVMGTDLANRNFE